MHTRFGWMTAVLIAIPAAGCSGGADDDDVDGDVGEVIDRTEGSDVEPEADVDPDGDAEDVEPEAEADVAPPNCEEGAPDGTSCDDDNRCTTDDICRGGLCIGAPVDCADGDPCTDDVCTVATGACTNPPNTAACDDGDPCTLDDVCGDGTCTGSPRDCSGISDDCNTGRCDSASGDCATEPREDGLDCDDLDPCTSDETCTTGTCGDGLVRDCSGLDDDCNAGRCDSASGDCVAEPVADLTICNDGHGCTTGDRCLTGVCTGNRPDGDGDGYFALGCLDGDDCDDTIYGVNPGRPEGPVGYATCFDRLDNDCDTFADFAEAACGIGLDLVVLDSPATMSVNVGTDTPIVRCRAYEPGGTEPPLAMPGLLGRIGYGPHLSDPTDNPAWTWVVADYWGQGGPGNTHDVFGGFFAPATAGTFSYTCRFSTDGATWVYADLDGNGAAPPANGLQVDRLGTLYVVVNDHLVLSEVVAVPTASEFVEIHNPTGTAVNLSTYHLTDSGDGPFGTTWRYWDIVTGSAGPIQDWDFVVRFPAAASIGPAARIVVGLRSAAEFRTAFGRSPDYELCPGSTNDPTVPDMVPAFAGAARCHSSGVLANGAETLVLFRWSTTTDLVQDVDIFQWGDTTEAMCKTGISRDGPDAGTTASTYLNDTAIASQRFLSGAPHPTSGSFERTSASEPGETRTGGNGITGHDETSEDFSTTWRIATAASPGS